MEVGKVYLGIYSCNEQEVLTLLIGHRYLPIRVNEYNSKVVSLTDFKYYTLSNFNPNRKDVEVKSKYRLSSNLVTGKFYKVSKVLDTPHLIGSELKEGEIFKVHFMGVGEEYLIQKVTGNQLSVQKEFFSPSTRYVLEALRDKKIHFKASDFSSLCGIDAEIMTNNAYSITCKTCIKKITQG